MTKRHLASANIYGRGSSVETLRCIGFLPSSLLIDVEIVGSRHPRYYSVSTEINFIVRCKPSKNEEVRPVSSNYQYCAEFVSRLIGHKATETKVLDFGCGRGQLIKLLRDDGIAAFGCDPFMGGTAFPFPDELSGIVVPMNGTEVQFPTSTFDVVVNNQVMEHIENMDAALSEIHRILKPGGVVLSLFPDRGVWREGHCSIPFLHWFPKHSTFPRVYYAVACRFAGLGQSTEGKSRLQWAKDVCAYLDHWTVYRTYKEIFDAYRKYFVQIEHIEDQWLDFRLGSIVRPFPKSLKRLFTRKMAGMVFTCVKAP